MWGLTCHAFLWGTSCSKYSRPGWGWGASLSPQEVVTLGEFGTPHVQGNDGLLETGTRTPGRTEWGWS